MELAIILVFAMLTLREYDAVYLLEGEIIGTTMMTRKGRNISAYLGIPYAEPPVGPLRFRNPVPKSKFDSVISGDTDGNVCPQLNDNGELIGDEDCLFLNVYTPQTNPDWPYPVMVYFHGGNYVKGSGSSTEAGPQYLLDRDIVLVTVNYRLGALGFLSTGDAQASGNYGLKDQNLALRWVKSNILAFDGHPWNVTIFGQEAGGACASLHVFSPTGRGLFQRYISQSGSGLAFWAFSDITRVKNYGRYSKYLGKKLKCPTEETSALVECLRRADVYSLVNSNDIFKNPFWSFSTWTPTIEPQSAKGTFLTNLPQQEVFIHGPYDIPAMIGIVADEGLLLTAGFRTNATIYDTIKKAVHEFFNYMTFIIFDQRNLKVADVIANDTEDYYLNGTDVNDRESLGRAITNLITDAGYAVPIDFMLFLTKYEAKSPGYEYSFDYRGTFSHSSLTTGNNENIGVAQGDDLIYLFPMNPKLKTSSDLRFSESDEKMIDTMIDLWTSFASTGTPTSNSTSRPFYWKPYEFDNVSHLKIGNQSDSELYDQPGFRSDAINFWRMQFSLEAASVVLLGR